MPWVGTVNKCFPLFFLGGGGEFELLLRVAAIDDQGDLSGIGGRCTAEHNQCLGERVIPVVRFHQNAFLGKPVEVYLAVLRGVKQMVELKVGDLVTNFAQMTDIFEKALVFRLF